MWKKDLTGDLLLRKAQELRAGGFKPGADDMNARSAELWFSINGDRLLKTLRQGDYLPMPVMGFRTAKKDGSFRRLTRLTAIDTVIQRALLEILQPVCEASFSEYSYAFRPGRGTGAALERFAQYGSAHRFAARLDPSDCFGSLDHKVLAGSLDAFFGDRELTRLLMAFAAAPTLEDGELRDRERGIPQGAPLSPLLCNLYLHSLDRYIQDLGVPFLRYADDVVIFGNDQKELEARAGQITAFLEEELRLTLNRRKYVLDAPFHIRFLGRRFLVGKDGFLTMDQGESLPAAYHAWQSKPIKNPGRTAHILSDGILRQRDYALLLETETGTRDLPILNTDCINIFSSVVFDSGFLRAAASHGITVNLFDQHGRLEGTFTPARPLRSPRTTFAQLSAYYDDASRRALAAAFVQASLHNLRLVIRYYNKNFPDPFYDETLSTLKSLELAVKEKPEHPQLLLLEARIREAYYRCFDRFTGGGPFAFVRRSRRPPRDPINAMMSFGNTVLYSYLATEINKSPLDVRVGFLHATNARAESLNLDLAELFKPLVVDRTIFTLINRRQLSVKRHFETTENGGVWLSPEGKRLFLEALNDKLHARLSDKGVSRTYLELMTEEVRKLARHFKTGEKYKPFKQVR